MKLVVSYLFKQKTAHAVTDKNPRPGGIFLQTRKQPILFKVRGAINLAASVLFKLI